MPTKLELTTYRPNFSDPRVIRRIRMVLAWCDGLRLSKAPRSVHHDKLLEIFGNPGRTLGRWLVSNLLIQTGRYQPGKRSYSYRLSMLGYRKVYQCIGEVAPSEAEIARSAFCHLASGEEVPVYIDRGDRRYHPVQNLRREIRREIFSGWWDYDIESCAPTLIHQYVTRADGFDGKPFPLVARMYEDKAALRQEVARITGLDANAVKQLLAVVFFRGNPAPSSKAAMFRILGGSYELHKEFTSSALFKQLRTEVRRLWALADQQDQFERAKQKLFDGQVSTRRPTSKSRRRMAIYLSLERRVMSLVERTLSGAGESFILMHDGFMTRNRTDCDLLANLIKEQTGFSVRLKEESIGRDVSENIQVDVELVMRGDVGDSE